MGLQSYLSGGFVWLRAVGSFRVLCCIARLIRSGWNRNAIQLGLSRQQWRVLAVTAEGTVEIFDLSSDRKQKSKKRKPLDAVGMIHFTTGDVPSTTVPVFAASFARNRGATHIITARGSAVAPVLEEVRAISVDPVDV